MHIKNNILTYAEQVPSPNRSGIINPKFIVMHYTATWKAASAVRTLTSKKSKVSAHVTMDTDGFTYQHVPFNVKAWHAGPSTYGGYSGLNNHTIGIELVNPGYLKKVGKEYVDAYGDVHSAKDVGDVVAAKYSRVGAGTFYWPVYPKKQLEAAEELVLELVEEYNILAVISHEEIDTRGWKTDPGPAFPINRFKNMVPNRAQDFDVYVVTASSLNMRSGPASSYTINGKLSQGDSVTVLESDGIWKRVDEDSWVHGSYLRRI